MTLADRACGNGDAKAAYAAIIRALESATIARAGVNVRDARVSEIAQRLQDQGVEARAAARFEELLRTCQNARFAPDAAPGTGLATQWKQARDAIGSLRRST
jgi:outer membrane protein assembly factor BamD (BamD/ComL family)